VSIARFPKDSNSREVCTRARGLVVYKLNSHYWEWHEQTGSDHGTDMVFELVENGEFTNRKIIGQIKGRTEITYLKDGMISFDFDVKTVNYAINSSNSFLLFLADVVNEIVYYLPIQEYFMQYPEKLKAARENKETVSVHINSSSILNYDSEELLALAKVTYFVNTCGEICRIPV
jgi:hypothetical protein